MMSTEPNIRLQLFILGGASGKSLDKRGRDLAPRGYPAGGPPHNPTHPIQWQATWSMHHVGMVQGCLTSVTTGGGLEGPAARSKPPPAIRLCSRPVRDGFRMSSHPGATRMKQDYEPGLIRAFQWLTLVVLLLQPLQWSLGGIVGIGLPIAPRLLTIVCPLLLVVYGWLPLFHLRLRRLFVPLGLTFV